MALGEIVAGNEAAPRRLPSAMPGFMMKKDARSSRVRFVSEVDSAIAFSPVLRIQRASRTIFEIIILGRPPVLEWPRYIGMTDDALQLFMSDGRAEIALRQRKTKHGWLTEGFVFVQPGAPWQTVDVSEMTE
jgi:hypothetical protein